MKERGIFDVAPRADERVPDPAPAAFLFDGFLFLEIITPCV
jgi:hypothetical protein